MNSKKCDRCGKYYESGIVTGLVLQKRVIFSYTKVDLCKECKKDLKEWFDQKSKEVEQES